MNSNCPLPQSQFDHIIIGHGSGGRMTSDLLRHVIGPELGDSLVLHELDAGFVSLPPRERWEAEDLVFTTDSFVVEPIFFPGGDIGKLSIVGTVNDLAMMGAEPAAISVAFILEEGFLLSDFRKVLQSMAKELKALNLKVTCGDTKVVPRGKGDKIFINTSGIGVRIAPSAWQPKRLQVGDVAILSREIGNHGTAILCARNQLGLMSTIQSDCHELVSLVKAMVHNNIPIHCARDLTRGGLLAAAVEIATTGQKQLELDEQLIPKQRDVASACELLGLDIHSMANEGACLFFVAPTQVEDTLRVLRTFSFSSSAAVIGKVVGDSGPGECRLKLPSGVSRRWVLPPGELLPRIC